MSLEKELNFFELKPEYSLVELKKAFRKIALKEHPDVGGDRVVFERSVDYFKTLEKACSNFGSGDDKCISSDKTIDGIKLSDLGKGYPITESAATCEVCDGHGYTSFHDEWSKVYQPCGDCFGTGIFSYPCKKCGGSGEYSRNGKVIGECNLCNGSGRFYPENKNPLRGFFYTIKYIPGTMKKAIACKRCDGSGTVFGYAENSKLLHRVCDKCEGIGEIKLFNPVLPRGFLAGMSK